MLISKIIRNVEYSSEKSIVLELVTMQHLTFDERKELETMVNKKQRIAEKVKLS